MWFILKRKNVSHKQFRFDDTIENLYYIDFTFIQLEF